MITLRRNGVSANGTSLQGYIEADYYDLVRLFGNPDPGYDDKTQAEWAFEVYDDTFGEVTVTIYDWKQGDAYLGPGNGRSPENIVVWNVGGHDKAALWAIESLLRDGWSKAA
jgi:hypothetical protein